jgi:hypothetical protein
MPVKEYSQMQRFISVLMIFILLPYLSGCTSTKIISLSNSDLPLPDSSRYSKYPYIIHSDKSKFLLEKSTISNGILSGRIKQIYSDNQYGTVGKKIQIYTSTDSVIKIDTGSILSVPLKEVTYVSIINKAELSETDNKGGMPFIIIVSALVAFVGIAFILFLINGWPNMLSPFDG